jgi:hypothetical protein
VTLIGTAYNLAPIGAWFPPFIETAIAASIFYMAIEGNPPMSRFAVDSPVVWGNPPHASLPLAIPAGTGSVGGNRVRIGFGQNRGKRDRLRGGPRVRIRSQRRLRNDSLHQHAAGWYIAVTASALITIWASDREMVS